MQENDAARGLPDRLVDAIAARLLAAAEPERSAILATLIAEHPRHASELRQLHADLGGAERLLDRTYPESGGHPPLEIDGHRVIRRLGEGAFGIVYLCAQERPVVRNVAVKVLRTGAGDQRTLQRFAAERQLLAELNHPAITHVFDAGELSDGRPFFVMEYVDGEPLRAYCDRRGLSCRQRLRLFVDVCRGVAHAHGRGIVHRDLKPANVLVIDTEAGPAPKIIDFGIAKVLAPGSDDGGPRTDAGRIIGTPGYMSPEQAAGATHGVDARADVFALGVMLYELLTGELPWIAGATASDTEPLRPSLRVTTATDSAAVISPTQRRQLVAALRGDLDWITLHALARDREDRYATVSALAADIECHLHGKPVSVGPPSVTYRLRKFVRRNRTLVASLGAAATLLTIGIGVSVAHGRAADVAIADAKQLAATSLANAEAVVEQLLVRANDPRLRDAPRSDEARQALLADALSFYDRFLRERPTDPRLRAGRCRALQSIATVQSTLGEVTRAASVATEAVDEANALFADAPDDVAVRSLLANALRQLGCALALAGNTAAAQVPLATAATHLAACAATAPEIYGASHAKVLQELTETLDHHLVQRRLEGMQESLAVIEALRRDHPRIGSLADDQMVARLAVARELCRSGQFDAADAMLTQAEQDLATVTTDRLRREYAIRSEQGRIAWRLGDRERSILRFQQAAAAATAWHAEQPQRLLPQSSLTLTLRDLGDAQNYVGAFDESSESFRRAVAQADAMVQQFPDDPSRVATLSRTLRHFARILWDRFRRVDLDAAAACVARAIEVNDHIAPTVDSGREPRWQLLAMQAGIRDSLGAPDAESWQAVADELPRDPTACAAADQDLLIEAYHGLARWHFAQGRHELTAEYLSLAREAIVRDAPRSDKRMVEVGWLEARQAAARGDHVEIAAAADRIFAARPTWFGTRRAADCLHLAWRCVIGANVVDRRLAADYHDRATALYDRVIRTLREDVGKDPTDPWHVLPWGFAAARAAELADASGDRSTATELLSTALPKLEAVRDAAHADLWEAEIYHDGHSLFERIRSDSVK